MIKLHSTFSKLAVILFLCTGIYATTVAQSVDIPNTCFETNVSGWSTINGGNGTGTKEVLTNNKSACSPADIYSMKWSTFQGSVLRSPNLPYLGPGTYQAGTYAKVPTRDVGNRFSFKLIVLDNGVSVESATSANITPNNSWGNGTSGYITSDIKLAHECVGSCTVHFQYVAKDEGGYHLDSASLARTALAPCPVALPNSCFETNATDWALINGGGGAGTKAAILTSKSNCSPTDAKFLKWQSFAGSSLRNPSLPYGGPGKYTAGIYAKVPSSSQDGMFTFRLVVLDNGVPMQTKTSTIVDPSTSWGAGNSNYYTREIELTHPCSGTCVVHYQIRASADGIYHLDSASLSKELYVLPTALAEQGCKECGEIHSTICQGDPAPDMEAYVMENDNYAPGADLNWYADDNGSKGLVLPTAPVVNSAQKGTNYYWVAQESGGLEGPAIRVRSKVKKTFTPNFQLPSVDCAGGQIDLAAWVSDPKSKAKVYTFYDVDPAQNLGASPLGSVSATKGVVDPGQHVIVNVNNGTNTYWVQSTVRNGCGGTAVSTTLAPSTASTLSFSPDQVIQNGDLLNIAFNAQNATHIIWVDHPSFNNPNIGIIGAQGLGNLIFTAQNTGTSPLTAQIRVLTYNGNCAGQYRDFNITVNPGPPTRQHKNQLHFFTMASSQQYVQLNWDINYEFDLIRFEVEKRGENGKFESIGFENWKGNGAYQFTDRARSSNQQAYRLKLVLTDGRVLWSEIIEVNQGAWLVSQFEVFPNPANNYIQVKAIVPIDGTQIWQLTDLQGKVLKQGEFQAGGNIEIAELAAGLYQFIITSSTGKRNVISIVKQ